MDSVVSPVSVVPHGLPLAMDRERSRVLVAESLHRAAAAANSGSLDAACALLADAETMLAASPSMQQRDPLCARLQEVLGAALRRLEETLDECKCRSGASRLEKPSLPQLAQLGDAMQAQSTSTSMMGVFVGGALAPAPDTRGATLKPRTFSVNMPLPFASLGAGNAAGASSSGNASSGGNAGGSAVTSATGDLGQLSPWQRRPLALTDLSGGGGGGGGGGGPGAADADGAAGAAEIATQLRQAGGIPVKASSMRLLGSVSSLAGRRPRPGGALRGRPRPPPPQLLPLHAPPQPARDGHDAASQPQLNIAPPLLLPAAKSSRSTSQGSLEAWLCRLLRMPAGSMLKPLPLPDDLIVHIFSFLQPAVLFHASLPLPSLIVDKCTTVRGHFSTITAALRAAHPGDRLIIKPGVYRESLRIDVPVMLMGCPGAAGAGGGGGGVTITSSRNHTVHSTAPFARMENITLRQTGSSGRSCLLISRGRLEVSDCDISSASGLCVEVTESAAPIVRHSRIHGGAAAGLWFRAAGGGLVEGNEIWGNGWSGVQISEESNPTLLRNYIHDNKSAGIISFNYGRGVAKHNDITSNGKGGVQVRSRACPELVCNRIFAERSFGVWVYEHGLGRFEDNDIINNAWSGFQVEEGSAPIVVGNRLRGNRSAGIVVYNRGSGTYEWNDISCNGRCGVQIKSGSAPYFRHNRIHHEKQAGVLTAEDGTGVLEDNDIFDNQWSGVQTEGPSNPLLRRNRIHHNGGAGFIAYQNGSGLLEGNNIYGNKKYGVQSKTGGHPTVRNNRIHDKVYGIYLTESGGGIYEENRIHNIRGTGIFVSADCSPVLANNHGTS